MKIFLNICFKYNALQEYYIKVQHFAWRDQMETKSKVINLRWKRFRYRLRNIFGSLVERHKEKAIKGSKKGQRHPIKDESK